MRARVRRAIGVVVAMGSLWIGCRARDDGRNRYGPEPAYESSESTPTAIGGGPRASASIAAPSLLPLPSSAAAASSSSACVAPTARSRPMTRSSSTIPPRLTPAQRPQG